MIVGYIIILFLLFYLVFVLFEQFKRNGNYKYLILTAGVGSVALGTLARVLAFNFSDYQPLYNVFYVSSMAITSVMLVVLIMVIYKISGSHTMVWITRVVTLSVIAVLSWGVKDINLNNFSGHYNITISVIIIVLLIYIYKKSKKSGPLYFLTAVVVMGIGGALSSMYSGVIFFIGMALGNILLTLGVGRFDALALYDDQKESSHLESFFLSTINTKILFAFLLVSIIPITAVSYINFSTSEQILSDSALSSAKNDIAAHVDKINLSLERYREDVLFLSKTPPIQGLIRAELSGDFDEIGGSTTEQWRDRLEIIFAQKAESNIDSYMQIRFIDEQGQEIVRIDSDGSRVTPIRGDALQNKFTRYYFIEAAKLDEGELYVSALDLNREGALSAIEVPYKPVIRYATPIFDAESNFQGILILNIFGSEILNTFHNVSGETETREQEEEEEFLLDSDGYYLQSPDSNKEWGGPRDINSGENFKNDYPELTTVFSLSSNSAFFSDVAVSHKRIYLAEEGSDPFWIVSEIVSRDILLEPVTDLRSRTLVVGLIIIVAIILIGFVFSRSIVKPIRKLQKGAQIIEKGNIDHKVGTNAQDEIGDLSRAFDKMTMAIKKSRFEIKKQVKKQTKEITNQKNAIEDQQKATLNILEDVEKEKEKTEALAKDLKKFNLAVENASDHIVITDKDGIILFANKGLELITGYSRKEVIGKKAGTKQLWGGNMSQSFYEKLWGTVKNKKKIFVAEILNEKKDGSKYTALASISPILDKKGDLEFIVAIERDITKEKEIDKAKTEFVSLASHQLRTPLSAINWYTEMLIAGDVGKLKKNQLEFMEEIYKGNKRMVELVNSLLNVSRIELGTFAIDPEETNIAELSSIITKELEPQIKKKKITFIQKISKQIPLMSVDPKLLSIVFQNLLSNAIKYTPEKGKVVFTLKKMKKDLYIEVTDTGYGIPKKQQASIFTKLFRADNVRSKDTEGTGLGLYIVKSILDQSGGSITFTSTEDKGTTFTAKIPLSGMEKKAGTKGLAKG